MSRDPAALGAALHNRVERLLLPARVLGLIAMQPYAPSAPSKAEALIAALRDPYKPQGDLRPLCLQAADEIERLREMEFKLAGRIHQQRMALRENWQIVEQRAAHRRAWVRSPLLASILRRGPKKPWWHRLLPYANS